MSARIAGAGSEVSPELRARLEKQRTAMAASRCPTCGNEPVEARARWQQRQDLAIVWLYPEPDQADAGDLAGKTPEATVAPVPVLRWLAEQGWHDDSDDGLVCGQH